MFFPESNGQLAIPDETFLHLVVEGIDQRLSKISGPSAVNVPISTTRVGLAPLPGSSRKTSAVGGTVNVKVVIAAFRKQGGKVEFTPQEQTFVDCTDTTANVDYIQSAIQRKWGPEIFMCTVPDGL